MKKITKKNYKLFIDKARELLAELGVSPKEETDNKINYYLETKLGKLNITLYKTEDSAVYSIYSRFEEPEKAREVFNCNPFTGKMNFHMYDKEEILWQLDSYIDSVINL